MLHFLIMKDCNGRKVMPMCIKFHGYSVQWCRLWGYQVIENYWQDLFVKFFNSCTYIIVANNICYKAFWDTVGQNSNRCVLSIDKPWKLVLHSLTSKMASRTFDPWLPFSFCILLLVISHSFLSVYNLNQETVKQQ